MTMMNWKQLLCQDRLNVLDAERDSMEIGRSGFHKDHDRIVFSSSFRRLARKTQVHPMAENDHVHTRLTHSMEVACVGRSLGMLVGSRLKDRLPADVCPDDLGAIVEAACLAHDIGNPPFGHAGEYAIRDWFDHADNAYLLSELSSAERQDLAMFDGNAQGLRVMTQLENHCFDGGLRLTYATLGTMLKYPWCNGFGDQPVKLSCYLSEYPILSQIAARLRLPQQGSHHWARHPLSYLMEAADDICYAILDLEDAIALGMVSYDSVERLLLPLCAQQCDRLHTALSNAHSLRRKAALLRAQAIQACVYATADSFLDAYSALMQGQFSGSLLAACRPPVSLGIEAAKAFAKVHVFNARRKIELEIGSFTCLDILLSTFLGAAYQLKTQPRPSFRSCRVLDLMEHHAPKPTWSLYESYRCVLDFISGMTDNYAQYLSQQL